MSQNPYQSAPLSNPAIVAPQQKPGALTAIAVICLILGILGILASLFAIIMLFFQDSINQFQAAQPGAPRPEAMAEMQAFQASQFLPNLIFGGCNVILGSLLAIGAVGVLGTNEWGRNLLRNSLLVAIFFVIIRAVYSLWVQFSSIAQIKKMIGDGQDAAAVEMGMQIGLIVGFVCVIAWLLVLIIFYVWSRIYLNKPHVRALFGAN